MKEKITEYYKKVSLVLLLVMALVGSCFGQNNTLKIGKTTYTIKQQDTNKGKLLDIPINAPNTSQKRSNVGFYFILTPTTGEFYESIKASADVSDGFKGGSVEKKYKIEKIGNVLQIELYVPVEDDFQGKSGEMIVHFTSDKADNQAILRVPYKFAGEKVENEDNGNKNPGLDKPVLLGETKPTEDNNDGVLVFNVDTKASRESHIKEIKYYLKLHTKENFNSEAEEHEGNKTVTFKKLPTGKFYLDVVILYKSIGGIVSPPRTLKSEIYELKSEEPEEENPKKNTTNNNKTLQENQKESNNDIILYSRGNHPENGPNKGQAHFQIDSKVFKEFSIYVDGKIKPTKIKPDKKEGTYTFTLNDLVGSEKGKEYKIWVESGGKSSKKVVIKIFKEDDIIVPIEIVEQTDNPYVMTITGGIKDKPLRVIAYFRGEQNNPIDKQEIKSGDKYEIPEQKINKEEGDLIIEVKSGKSANKKHVLFIIKQEPFSPVFYFLILLLIAGLGYGGWLLFKKFKENREAKEKSRINFIKFYTRCLNSELFQDIPSGKLEEFKNKTERKIYKEYEITFGQKEKLEKALLIELNRASSEEYEKMEAELKNAKAAQQAGKVSISNPQNSQNTTTNKIGITIKSKTSNIQHDTVDLSKKLPLNLRDLWADTMITQVYIARKCYAAIQSWLNRSQESENPVEVGGFLVGTYQQDTQDADKFILHLEELVADEHAEQDVYELKFSDEVMFKIDDLKQRNPHWLAVGWFHTHPGHTPFLSSHDIRLHEGSFPHPYQLAMVIDPNTEHEDMGIFTRTSQGRMNNRGDLKDTWFSWLDGVHKSFKTNIKR